MTHKINSFYFTNDCKTRIAETRVAVVAVVDGTQTHIGWQAEGGERDGQFFGIVCGSTRVRGRRPRIVGTYETPDQITCKKCSGKLPK